ncbi:MAG: tetratricopeptide repeat protein [Candidatus Riflebacteria bacterium]
MKAWLNFIRTAATAGFLAACLINAGCCGRKQTLEDAGKAYQSGDFAKASQIFMPAAEQGDAEAQVNIAFMYYCGMHFPKDQKKAAEWYLKAAKRNHTNAQFSLGTLYENGEGVKRSIGEAYFWYSLAEKNGDKDAKRLRQELELKLNSNQIKELKKRIASWKPEH